MALIRAVEIDPFVIRAPVAAVPIFAGQQSQDGFWLVIAVRNMNTSTWVGLGTKASQASLMYYSNDFWVKDCPPGYVLNFADYWIISENGDVDLEITGLRAIAQPSALLPGVVFPDPLTAAL